MCQSQTLMQNVQPPVRSLLTAMHHALFKETKTDVSAVKKLLTQFVADSKLKAPMDVKMPVVSTVVSTATVWVAPNRQKCYHDAVGAHGYKTLQAIALSEAVKRKLYRCTKCAD